MKPLHRSFTVISILLLAALLLSACVVVPAQPQPVICVSEFSAQVNQGPNAGLRLDGKLALKIDSSGAIEGLLRQADGSEVMVSGQATGRAISLAFDVGNGKYIFGTGASLYDVRECKGPWGGPFAGPDAGDSGDWLALTIEICIGDIIQICIEIEI